MAKHTTSRKATKAPRDFPLFKHATGRWCKKVRGKFKYFGYVAKDPAGEAALALWLDQKDDLLAGRPPRVPSSAITVGDLGNKFLNHKRRLRDAGDITVWTFDEYEKTARRVVKMFGTTTAVNDLRPDDFGRLRLSIAKQWGPVRLGNEIGRIRGIFKYGVEAELIDRLPKFGPDFKKPTAKSLRIARAQRGNRLFEREELLALLDAAPATLRAMILLGINSGMGNNDVATLPIDAVDLKRGWITFPRPKTGVERRIPLWPETIEAIQAALKSRPTPTDPNNEGLLFITPTGKSFIGNQVLHPVADKMARTLRAAKLNRKGLSFYSLRHSFQTKGERARDLAAVRSIMGHSDSQTDMSATYREGIDDDRLRAVVEHVRTWLYGSKETK